MVIIHAHINEQAKNPRKENLFDLHGYWMEVYANDMQCIINEALTTIRLKRYLGSLLNISGVRDSGGG